MKEKELKTRIEKILHKHWDLGLPDAAINLRYQTITQGIIDLLEKYINTKNKEKKKRIRRK